MGKKTNRFPDGKCIAYEFFIGINNGLITALALSVALRASVCTVGSIVKLEDNS